MYTSEFLEFAQNQDQNTQKWQDAEQELPGLQENVKNLKNEKITLETKLKHARGQIDHEIRKRKRAEEERDDLVCMFYSVTLNSCVSPKQALLLCLC